MSFKRVICYAISILFVLADVNMSQAAPPQGDLPPANVTNTSKFKVVVSNPETNNGEAKLLALRAEVGPDGVSKVVFEVSKDGKYAFSATESKYPYCLFGDRDGKCAYLLAGDETREKFALKPGNYTVKVMVFGNSSTPEWSGVVKFNLVVGDLTSPDLPYGTGSGNNPIVKIVDPYWRKEGMRNIRIEARLLNGGKDKQVQYVRYSVTRDGDDNPVYVGIELDKPYCIFGELNDRKTCKTLRAGDTWPQSYDRKSEGDGYVKEAIDDIPRSKIVAGDYHINIFVSTSFGTWSSKGDFKLFE